jgi:hypothetical protein
LRRLVAYWQVDHVPGACVNGKAEYEKCHFHSVAMTKIHMQLEN